MALVDYGSGSDSEPEALTSETSAPRKITPNRVQPLTANASKSSLFSTLPPPQGHLKSSLNLPPPSNSTASQTKKTKGPKKILLDLPSASSTRETLEGEPSAKRPKLEFSTIGNKNGLSALLPAPKASFLSLPPPSKPDSNGSKASALQSTIDDDDPERAALAKILGTESRIEAKEEATGSSTMFVPKAASKSRSTSAKQVKSVPSLDFFSLGESLRIILAGLLRHCDRNALCTVI